MHYRNGREAKNGDKIVVLGNTFGGQTVGVLHSAVAGNDYCNGMVAPIAGPMSVNLKDCLHLDDMMLALGDPDKVPDSTKGA